VTLFGPDFYPTPPEVAAEMLDPLDLRGRTVLEPSAGKGDLVRECLARDAAEVLWCEAERELQHILVGIADARPAHAYADFLQVHPADVSHIDLIVMNPPFSADERHILDAIDEDGRAWRFNTSPHAPNHWTELLPLPSREDQP